MTTSYSIGDPIKVADADGDIYAVVIGTPAKGIVEVQLLEKGTDHIYRIGSDCYHVDHESIMECHHLHGDDDKAPRAFDTMGFRMLDGESFVKHSDEANGHLFPIGEAIFDMESSDDEEDLADPTLDGFIVPDAECEPFTQATGDSDFVRETHEAVRAFNGWVPKDEQEAQARSFVIRQEARASHVDDEARSARNMPGTNYSQPGI